MKNGISEYYKETIKEIELLSNDLKSIISFSKKCKRDIIKSFNFLYKNNYFLRCAKNDLFDMDFKMNDDKFYSLISNLHKYNISLDDTKKSLGIIELIKNEYSNDISIVKKCLNPFLRFFVSKKKKDLIDYYNNRIEKFIDSSLNEDVKRMINNLHSYETIDLNSSYNDFLNNKCNYENTIKELTVDKRNKPRIKEIIKLIRKHDTLKQRISNLNELLSNQKSNIKQAIDNMAKYEFNRILYGISIDELSKEKRGIRVKTFRDAGYGSIGKLYYASMSQLVSIKGISQNQAYLVKHIVEAYAREVEKNIKIRLSYDDKNNASSALVARTYLYIVKDDIIRDITNFMEKRKTYINDCIKELKNIWSAQYWCFYNDEYKNQIRGDYYTFKSLMDGEFYSTVDAKITDFNYFEADVDEAWNSFKKNPIRFIDIISNITPSLIDNDYKYYGLSKELANEIDKEVIYKDGLLCHLRKYQEWGVKYILHQKNVLLGDEMGLGKTIQAIASMVSLKNQGATYFVVVCPASVIINWCREIVKHSTLNVVKVHGSFKEQAYSEWISSGGVAVTTYEAVSAFMDINFYFSMLVVDEAHYIKNRNAVRTAKVLYLAQKAYRLLFMTGTPIENRVDEMISLIYTLNSKVAYSIANIQFMASAPRFRELVAPVYYRRRREDVLTELPDLIENDEWCDINIEEKKAYAEAIMSKNYMQSRRVSWNVDIEKSSKFMRLKEIVEEAKSDGRKILVFSFFLDTLRKVYYGLSSGMCLTPIDGSVSPSMRQSIIDEFNASAPGTVLCAQIQTGGTGLNIQAASVVIICEPQLKPSTENQAISRAYRMGQSRNVQVFRLLCNNTIDERIVNLLNEKQNVFNAFADKSTAAQSLEINNEGLGKIINDEIERLNKEK